MKNRITGIKLTRRAKQKNGMREGGISDFDNGPIEIIHSEQQRLKSRF